MVEKLKSKFIPIDYAFNLLRRLYNLKQVNIVVKEYIGSRKVIRIHTYLNVYKHW